MASCRPSAAIVAAVVPPWRVIIQSHTPTHRQPGTPLCLARRPPAGSTKHRRARLSVPVTELIAAGSGTSVPALSCNYVQEENACGKTKTGPTIARVSAQAYLAAVALVPGVCRYRNRPAAITRHAGCGVRCAGPGHPSPTKRPAIQAGQLATHAPFTLGGVRGPPRTSGGSLRSQDVFVPPPVPRWGKRG